MKLQTEITKQSQAFHGVSFTIRPIGPSLASRIAIETATDQAEANEKSVQALDLESEYDLKKFRTVLASKLKIAPEDLTPQAATEASSTDAFRETMRETGIKASQLKETQDLMLEASDITQAKIWPVLLRHALIRVEGVEVEGAVEGEMPVATMIMDYAPSALVGEIIAAIQDQMRVGPEARKNSSSPTTTSEPAQLGAPNSSATTASGGGSGNPGTAGDTSLTA